MQCAEQRYADPRVAGNNPEKPEGDLLGLCLQPAVWEGKEIVVTVNNTHFFFLDQPATQGFLIARKFSHVGYGKGIPVSFPKNIALEGCLGVFPKLIMGHDKHVCIIPSYYFLKVIE